MRKWLLFWCFLAGIIGFGDRPKAAGPTATFHVIGDLPGGGATTVIKDATEVDGVIYAVGGAVARVACPSGPPPAPCASTDTAILWRSDGNGTPQALPDIASPVQNPAVTAFAITRNASYIASTARDVIAGTTNSILRAVRVTTNTLSNDENLSAYSPALTVSAGAVAVSESGTVLYGNASGLAIRFDTATQTKVNIPLLCPSVGGACTHVHNVNGVAEKGTSADGSVAVGTSSFFSAPNVFNRLAYRYVHASGVATAIPLLPGGTTNTALAVSPDGNLVLVVGNGVGAPNSEPYLYRAGTGEIQRLGSPNNHLLEAWGPGGRICSDSQGSCSSSRAIAAGMTADGSVVVMTFGSPSRFGGQYAYFHNQHGWFHLSSALFAYGVDLGDGWDPETLVLSGISPDGTLVFGAGAENGVVKGFVAEFPAGALASFNPTPASPENPSLVGAWIAPGAPDEAVVFTADGAYFHIGRMESGDFVSYGFERGFYTYDGSAITITTLFDNSGHHGLSDANGTSFALSVVGDEATFLDDPVDSHLERVVGGPGSILGGWVQGNPTVPGNSFVTIFLDSLIFQATDNPDFGGPGAEGGTYTFGPESICAPFTHELNIFPEGGAPDLHNCGTLASNELEIHALDDDGLSEFHFARVIDPRTPLITSALDAVATVGLPFAYQITATNSPTSFGAFGLPSWLSFDPDTGLISGTPPAVAPVDIRVEASNSLSTITGRNHLSLVVVAPAIVSEGPTTVTPIPPEEPGETPPITIEFENVTNGGTISVATIDPEIVESAPEPPAGFSLGDDPVYFEIVPSEELTFTGPVTVCFSYEGITFSGFPRLLHYDEGLMTWVDITTSVDTENQIICGLTSSFSPFVIAAAALDARGFHAPVKPVAGQMNTVKGGSTVALKFNVFGEGNVEITNPDDIDNLRFEVSPAACEGGTAEQWDLITTTGNTSLRYATRHHEYSSRTGRRRRFQGAISCACRGTASC
ncbi:MAG: putative Ig domain-containing protein [Vicinamibacterales bacterium]